MQEHVVKVKGCPIELGGKVLILPPLSLRSLDQLLPRIRSFSANVHDEQYDTGLVVDVAFAALTRNYPDLQRDDLLDQIDLGNMMDIMQAAMDISGMRRKSAEEQAKGEAKSRGTS